MTENPYESPRIPDASDKGADTESAVVSSSYETNASLAADYYQPPKLSMVHIMAWLVLAGAFSVVTFLQGSFHVTRWDLVNIIKLLNLILSIVLISAGDIGTVVIVRDKLRRAVGRLQPGHWLLFIVATTCFVRWLIQIIPRFLYGPPEVHILMPCETLDPPSIWHIVRDHTIGFATTIAFIVMAFRIREKVIWSLLALVLAIMMLGSELWALSYAYAFCGTTWINHDHVKILLGVCSWTGILSLIVYRSVSG